MMMAALITSSWPVNPGVRDWRWWANTCQHESNFRLYVLLCIRKTTKNSLAYPLSHFNKNSSLKQHQPNQSKTLQKQKQKLTSYKHSLPSQKQCHHKYVHMHTINILKTNLCILHPVLTLSPWPRGTYKNMLTPLFFFFFPVHLRLGGTESSTAVQGGHFYGR